MCDYQNLAKPGVKERIAALEQRFKGVKIIVGVDRLDYIKGVPQKLHALEVFLTEHPEWIGKARIICHRTLTCADLSDRSLQGCPGAARRAIASGRRRVPKPSLDCE